jgi:hypothetical protein
MSDRECRSIGKLSTVETEIVGIRYAIEMFAFGRLNIIYR